MAPTGLTPLSSAVDVEHATPTDPRREAEAGPLIRRPAELVELAELVYRGIFEAGLAVAVVATAYAGFLTALQPAGHRVVAATVCGFLLLLQCAAVHRRRALFARLRYRPWLVLLPGLAIGSGAWAAGSDNQQLFYVLTILLGTLGAAVPLRVITLASILAAVGLAAPHISDGTWSIGEALAAGVLPPLLWLIVEQLARFMLRLHQPLGQPTRSPPSPRFWIERRPATPTASTTRSTADAPRQLPPGEVKLDSSSSLTARQLQVLLLCTEGLKHAEIGACLEIGAVQVGRHLCRACDRAGVATTPQLVAWAISTGLVPAASWAASP
jgi:DNA-binding CsgD family transcriptional regulator